MREDLTQEDMARLGYSHCKKLPNGEWLAIQNMLYTTGLFIVVDSMTWRTRFCYEDFSDAVDACLEWDGEGDPPGNWIKQKPEDRLNPKWTKEQS